MVAVTAAPEIERFYREQRDRSVRLAFLLTGSPEVAEELTQEAFLRIWPQLHHLDNPAAYLRTVLVNLARGHHRRRATERDHPPVPPGPALPGEIDETWHQLWLLPERQRAALVLRFYTDMDVAGVADALGCRLGTAKSLIHRGLARLKEVLEP
jgi:RNA polymerase sigma factor (sigma-70 family)